MTLKRKLGIAAVLVVVLTFIMWRLTRSHGSPLVVVPIGRVLQPDGRPGFVVAVTNYSGSTIHCVAGHTQIFIHGDGSQTTNFMEMKSGLLAPAGGAHFAFDAPTSPPPWSLTVAYKPMLSQTMLRLRSLGARLHLCKFVVDFQYAETTEISK